MGGCRPQRLADRQGGRAPVVAAVALPTQLKLLVAGAAEPEQCGGVEQRVLHVRLDHPEPPLAHPLDGRAHEAVELRLALQRRQPLQDSEERNERARPPDAGRAVADARVGLAAREQLLQVHRQVQHILRVGIEGAGANRRGGGKVEPARVPVEHHHARALAAGRRRPARGGATQLDGVPQQPRHRLAALVAERAHLHRPPARLALHRLVEGRPVALALVRRRRAHLVALVRQVDDDSRSRLPHHHPKVLERRALWAHRRDEGGRLLAEVVNGRRVDVLHRLQVQQRVHIRPHLPAEAVELVRHRRLVRPAVAERVVLGRLALLPPAAKLLLDDLFQAAHAVRATPRRRGGSS
mmetsp:Transcript_43717/g.144768  ORF Transcript_43717/g.144768 Transcript_43717/m.144768 type:complete len:353 (+) Transcript_43717:280-1338(+)